jgi:hypothetical protein
MSYGARTKVLEARFKVQGADSRWFGSVRVDFWSGHQRAWWGYWGVVDFFFDSIYYIYTLAKKISL